jgi:F420-0:gamma-glutamyl ligase
MKVTPIKTPIVHLGDDLEKIITENISYLPEKSVLVVTGKIISLSERAIAEKITGTKDEKWALVRQEAEFYTEATDSEYQLMLTVKDQILAVNAGIDESNADGTYVLFPKKPYESAARIWTFLREQYKISEVGVLIIDSRTFPLKWGIIGTSLAHCGFKALNNKIGELDLFGKEMQMTQENMTEGLAVAANVVMGEVAESQPFALIEDVPMVQFQDHSPTQAELQELKITLTDDAYAPILLKADWKKGGASTS